MFEHLVHAVHRAFVRALVALVVAGALAAAYGAGLVWVAAHTGEMQPLWLLVASLSVVAGLASAALVIVWQAAPAIAAVRGLEYLADQAPEAVAQDAHEMDSTPQLKAPALDQPVAAR